MTYATLKADVLDWVAHGQATANVASFVRLAEAVIRRDVRVPVMDSTVSGSMADGAFDVPADAVELRRVVVNSYPLDYVPVERFQELETSGARGYYFTRIGNQVKVLQGGTGAYSLLYRAKFAALTDDSDTNWLLSNAYDVYLFQSLKQAAVYLKDVAAAQAYDTLYVAAKDALNLSESMSQNSGGSMSMNVGSPV